MKKQRSTISRSFDHFSNQITRAAGSPVAFFLAILIIVVWAITGPVFKYSDTWQLVINTGTTIITFVMVFVIQQTQNKDTMAIHLKLNELIASSEMASNRLVDSEDFTEEELRLLKKFYVKLSTLAKEESDIHQTHSIDEAQKRNAAKHALNHSRKQSPHS